MSSSVPPDPLKPSLPPKGKKSDALVGSVVNGKYRILSLVAAGGMGKIYEAEQIALGRSVALKVLHTTEVDEENKPQFKKRFLREASILARLQHPNVVTIFDYGAIEGMESEQCFISMEFLSGETLAKRIADRRVLPARETIRIARQIARGLTEAHAHGIIHRDLKPSNVMLLAGRDGEELAKIVDFGIVKIIGDDSQEKEEDLTQEGSFIGSPKYMAPEQIARGGKIDARTDVYSFGIILYQCLTGTVPFDGASSIQTLMAHLNQAPDPIRVREPRCDAPDWLEQLVMSCIEKEPAKRPQTMDGVAKTLAEADAALSSSSALAAMARRSSGPPANLGLEPTLAEGLAGGSSAALRVPSTTTQGTTASVPPPETEKTRTSPGVQRDTEATTKRGKKKSRTPIALTIGVTVLLVGAVAFRGLRHAAPIAPAPVAAAPVAASHVTLRIESTPSGADVREGDRVLGTTPLDLVLDGEALRVAPRRLTLVKEGYAPYPIEQGASGVNVRVVAQLAASATAVEAGAATEGVSVPVGAGSAGHGTGAGAGAATGARRAPAHAAGAASGAASGRPDLDIRMNR